MGPLPVRAGENNIKRKVTNNSRLLNFTYNLFIEKKNIFNITTLQENFALKITLAE